MARRGPIIAAAVSVVAVVLAVVLLLLPEMNKVKAKRDEVTQAQGTEVTLRSTLANLKEAQANAPQTNKQIAKIDTQVPPTADLPGLLRMLRQAADSSAVDFFTVSPGQPTLDASSQFSVIPTQMTINGSYFSLEEFVYRLETLPRAGKIINISISGQAGAAGGATETTSLTMQLTVQFFTSDTSAGPGSSPGPSTGSTTPGSSGSAS
jgi:Tfp pilus assembly protein PilO